MLTREEVLANRQKWVAFLKNKHRQKAKGELDSGYGERCCLGHACYTLGIKRHIHNDGSYSYGKNQANVFAPEELVNI